MVAYPAVVAVEMATAIKGALITSRAPRSLLFLRPANCCTVTKQWPVKSPLKLPRFAAKPVPHRSPTCRSPSEDTHCARGFGRIQIHRSMGENGSRLWGDFAPMIDSSANRRGKLQVPPQAEAV